MDSRIPELEAEFRSTWKRYDAARITEFLADLSDDDRPELLTRLLSIELEFSFQPHLRQSSSNKSTRPDSTHIELDATVEEDEDRVKPRFHLFILQFPLLSKHPQHVLRLIVLEYALRLRYDSKAPSPESYLALYDGSQDRLAKLLELTESKLLVNVGAQVEAPVPVQASDSTVPEVVSTSIASLPLPSTIGYFLLVRLLDHGGMGFVHSAIDLRTGAQVAVKLMRHNDSWSIYRFIEEFNHLSQFQHPNLVKLYDAFSEGDMRYFSMELVEGESLIDWYGKTAGSPNRWHQLRNVLSQTASALNFLHSRGIIHRDVKCKNVMITSRLRAVLLDLGLASRIGESCVGAIPRDDDRIAGTLHYLSPEVLQRKQLTAASDWYSFGVMIYQLLVDDFPPIEINLSASVAEKVYQTDKRRIAEQLQDFPEDLAHLCTDLLEAKPEDRPTGDQILLRLGGSISAGGSMSSVDSVVFDREAVFERLRRVPVNLQNHRPSFVALIGPAGYGKSTILKHWLMELAPLDLFLFNLRCYKNDHTPLRLLNLLVQGLFRVIREVNCETREALFKKCAFPIARVFPQFRHVLEEQKLSQKLVPSLSSDPAAWQASGLECLANFLVRLSQEKPILIVADDAQWSDPNCMQFFVDLFKDHPNQRIAIVFTYEIASDTEPAQELTLFNAINSLDSDHFDFIHLAQLSETECARAVNELAELLKLPISERVSAALYQRSNGIPFLLLEQFRAFTSSVEASVGEEVWLNADFQQNTLRRFSSLPRSEERILFSLACANQPLRFHQLHRMSTLGTMELQAALNRLSSLGWISLKQSSFDSEVELAHDNFRSLILETFSDDQIRLQHFRIAETLSSELPPQWSRIGDHFWNAKDFSKAAACYVEAGRQAAKSGVFADAAYFLQLAMHPDADRRDAEQLQVKRLLADCYANAGHPDKAARIYLELADGTRDKDEQLLLSAQAGEQLIRAGDLDAGVNLLRQVLRQAGIVITLQHQPFAFLLRSMLSLLNFWKRVPEEVIEGAKPFSPIESCLNRVAIPLTFLDRDLGAELILFKLRISVGRGSLEERSHSQVHAGALLSLFGPRLGRPAIRRLQMGRKLARRAGESAQAFSLFCTFIWYSARGRFPQSMRTAKRAIQVYEKYHKEAIWEICFLKWASISNLWHTMQFDELRVQGGLFAASMEKQTDPMSLFWKHTVWGTRRAMINDDTDQIQHDLLHTSSLFGGPAAQVSDIFLWVSLAQVELYQGRPRAAKKIFADSWNKIQSSSVLSSANVKWEVCLVKLKIALLSYIQDGDTESLDEAVRVSKTIKSLPWKSLAKFHRAYDLVIGGLKGRPQPQSSWDDAFSFFQKEGFVLLAYALRWHQSLYAPPETSERLLNQAIDAFRSQGVRNPRRLMNVILPLPRSSEQA